MKQNRKKQKLNKRRMRKRYIIFARNEDQLPDRVFHLFICNLAGESEALPVKSGRSTPQNFASWLRCLGNTLHTAHLKWYVNNRDNSNEKFHNIQKYFTRLSRYSDSLRAGRSGDRISVGARFSAPVQTGPGTHPASYTMGTGSLSLI
jgi:hypothetical protein